MLALQQPIYSTVGLSFLKYYFKEAGHVFCTAFVLTEFHQELSTSIVITYTFGFVIFCFVLPLIILLCFSPLAF